MSPVPSSAQPFPEPGASAYWEALARLVREHRVVIDRPRGSAHPRFPELVYPLDYGYLEGTVSMDGSGIDVFVGGADDVRIRGIICTVDLMKNDSEIKILYRCTDADVATALAFLNGGYMRGLFVEKPGP